MKRTVIGIVGPMASGKGVAVDLLSRRGFVTYSLSDILRSTAEALQIPPDREILQDIGDLLRKHCGNGVLAERTVQLITKRSDLKITIDSVRNPTEMEVLRKLLGARFIGIDASFERCFQNMLIRGRSGDLKTWEEFLPLAQRDRGIGQAANGQQVDKCLELSSPHIIQNDSTLEVLRSRIENEFITLGIESNRRRTELE